MLSQISLTYASREQSSVFYHTSEPGHSVQVEQCANEILEDYWLKKNNFCEAVSTNDTWEHHWYAEFPQSILFDTIYSNNNFCKSDFEIKKKVLSYFHTKFPLLNNYRISCEEFYCLQKIEEKYDKMLEYKKETHFCDLSVKKKKDKIKKWVRDERNQVTKNCMHIDRVDNNEQFNDWVSRMIKSMCRRD